MNTKRVSIIAWSIVLLMFVLLLSSCSKKPYAYKANRKAGFYSTTDIKKKSKEVAKCRYGYKPSIFTTSKRKKPF